MRLSPPVLVVMASASARLAAAMARVPPWPSQLRSSTLVRAVASEQGEGSEGRWRGLDEPPERMARWELPTAEATEQLGRSLARCVMPGDVILLAGDVGAGKSTLARALVREFMQDPDLLVSSPSYLVDITYNDPEGNSLIPGVTIHHMDLWRLKEGSIERLVDLSDVYSRGVSLVEWPEKLGAAAPPAEQCLQVVIESAKDVYEDSQQPSASAPAWQPAPREGAGVSGDGEEGGEEEDGNIEPRCATLSTFADSWSSRIEHMMTETLFQVPPPNPA